MSLCMTYYTFYISSLIYTFFMVLVSLMSYLYYESPLSLVNTWSWYLIFDQLSCGQKLHFINFHKKEFKQKSNKNMYKKMLGIYPILFLTFQFLDQKWLSSIVHASIHDMHFDKLVTNTCSVVCNNITMAYLFPFPGKSEFYTMKTSYSKKNFANSSRPKNTEWKHIFTAQSILLLVCWYLYDLAATSNF